MRDNALHFPSIALPQETWTTRTLLYWDSVLSIVPLEYVEQPAHLGPFMQELVRNELVRQIFPSHHIFQIDGFEQTFIEFLESKAHRRALNRRRSNAPPHPTYQIHFEKLGHLPEYLIGRRLASRSSSHSWLNVDGVVARQFMAYLAICLGALPEVNAAPATGDGRLARLLGLEYGALRPNGRNYKHHMKARQVVLKNILPCPVGDVSPDEISLFKQQHGALLPDFRRRVETQCAAIASLESPEDRLDATQQFIQHCRHEVQSIHDAMKPRWGKIMFGSLTPLFGAGAVWKATDPVDVTMQVGVGLSFAAAAYQAINSVRERRIEVSQLPLAYLAHAQTRLYA